MQNCYFNFFILLDSTIFSLLETMSVYFLNPALTRAFIEDHASNGGRAFNFSKFLHALNSRLHTIFIQPYLVALVRGALN